MVKSVIFFFLMAIFSGVAICGNKPVLGKGFLIGEFGAVYGTCLHYCDSSLFVSGIVFLNDYDPDERFETTYDITMNVGYMFHRNKIYAHGSALPNLEYKPYYAAGLGYDRLLFDKNMDCWIGVVYSYVHITTFGEYVSYIMKVSPGVDVEDWMRLEVTVNSIYIPACYELVYQFNVCLYLNLKL